ncbi:hypothetical protein [Paenibacillus sp. YYML68]|uniref:hypothetical protein n=1 Tax=Paenibacillus sp. YYML68 TaxID=2909250 RepID=UPI0024936D3C|nr:hypothetical protein [Paenibacillus sp. YYML68]
MHDSTYFLDASYFKLRSPIRLTLSIERLNGRTVHTRSAVVRLVSVTEHDITFATPLRLPDDHEVQLRFELAADELRLSWLGMLLRQEGEGSSNIYAAQCTLQEKERSHLLRRLAEASDQRERFYDRATESYQLHMSPIYNYTPLVNVQT